MSDPIVIVSAARTPIGAMMGELSGLAGQQLGSIAIRAAVERAGLKPEQVTLHTTFLGGGFGRRATPSCDWVSEAVHVAKAAGTAVKTVWSREDDVRGGYYRPMVVHRIRAALGGDGLPQGWDHTVVCQSVLAGSPFEAMIPKNGVDPASVEGAADSPYLKAIPNHRVQLQDYRAPVPVLWWRSVGHSHTAFAMESMVDELARAAGADPVEYRRRLLADRPRLGGRLAGAPDGLLLARGDGIRLGVQVPAADSPLKLESGSTGQCLSPSVGGHGISEEAESSSTKSKSSSKVQSSAS